ncbi:MAG: CPBP family intramembrane glutamic endopeptidase [Longimicrobiales bacterium]|nr:CPBP family intramembrane glutamic endopeptidase [Longimicrobiales bacterium]
MTRRLARALGVLALLITLGLWIALDQLAWPARALTTFLLGPLPALMILQARLVDQLPTDAEREAVYFSSAFSVWILAALAMLAARHAGLTRGQLGLDGASPATLVGAAGLTTLVGLGFMAAGRALKVPETALVDYLIPRSSSERIAFTGLSVSAGIAEELVFRSFLIVALDQAFGSLSVAIAVSVAAFAVTHAYQGVVGMLRVAMLGLVLTAPFIITGSIYPSMIAHTVLDLLAGLVLADWLAGGTDGRGE